MPPPSSRPPQKEPRFLPPPRQNVVKRKPKPKASSAKHGPPPWVWIGVAFLGLLAVVTALILTWQLGDQTTAKNGANPVNPSLNPSASPAPSPAQTSQTPGSDSDEQAQAAQRMEALKKKLAQDKLRQEQAREQLAQTTMAPEPFALATPPPVTTRPRSVISEKPQPTATPQPVETAAPTPLPTATPLPTPSPSPSPTTVPEDQSIPVAPLAGNQPSAVPALPVETAKLTPSLIAAYQVTLERHHFSCGFIDGSLGMRTQRMLRAFQTSNGLPPTGVFDSATRRLLGDPGHPYATTTITEAELSTIHPRLTSWREKAQAKTLGYSSAWEMYAEKYHCKQSYLRSINPNVVNITPGTVLNVPNLEPLVPTPQAASLRISLSETSIEALDANGRIVGFFPCSIAADKAKRPSGALAVVSVVPDPDYTFDPSLFKEAAANEHLTHKLLIPPGPRNPVGTAWIGLNLPGYGIHGTPEPENISRTQSHGCFRLANWNARTVLRMVKVGTPVEVVP